MAWLGVFLGAIGAWQLCSALVGGAYLGTQFMIASGMRAEGIAMMHDYYAQLVRTGLQAALGLALLLRGQGLAGLVHRLRTAGNMGDLKQDP